MTIPLLILMSFGILGCAAISYDLNGDDLDVVACEGSVANISCPFGQKINIMKASYGRKDRQTCRTGRKDEEERWTIGCYTMNAIRVVTEMCENRSECLVPATNDLFNDSCPGTVKYLTINYSCRPVNENTTFSSTTSTNIPVTSLPTTTTTVVTTPTSSPTSTSTTTTTGTTMTTTITTITTTTTTTTTSPSTQGKTTTESLILPPPTEQTPPIVSFTNGSVVIIKVINITTKTTGNKKYCPKYLRRNMYWSKTVAGEYAYVLCPNNNEEKAKWKCDESSAKWLGLPDTARCISPAVKSFMQFLSDWNPRSDVKSRMSSLLDYLQSTEDIIGSEITALIHSTHSFVRDMEMKMDGLNKQESLKVTVDINEGVANMTNILLTANHMEGWEMDLPIETMHRISSKMIDCIERSSFIRAQHQNSSFKINFNNLNVHMHVLDVASHPIEELSFRDETNSRRQTATDDVSGSDEIKLGGQTVYQLSENGLARVLFTSYTNLNQLLVPRSNVTNVNSNDSQLLTGEDLNTSFHHHQQHQQHHHQHHPVVVGTKVISASVNKLNQNGDDDYDDGGGVMLLQPVVYTLKHLNFGNYSKPSCSYWSFPSGTKEGSWMDEGCQVVGHNSTHTTCHCSHLTNFAVLMTVSGQMDYLTDSRHSFALSFITYFGCIISLISLLASFLIFTLVRSIQCKRNTIHKNLVGCLCVAEIIFLFGIIPTSSQILCSMVAVCLHFFFLCSFMWMLLEGVQLYIMLIQVFEVKRSRLLWYFVIGYGLPAVIVIISLSVNYRGYGTKEYCWLSISDGFIWAFVGPVCLIMLLNLIFLGMTMVVMCKHAYFSPNSKVKEMNTIEQISSWAKVLATLVVLLGLTWFFGVLYVTRSTIAMAYLFTFFNSFQGLFIFIFHCVLNEKVRKALKKCYQRETWAASNIGRCLSIRSSSQSSPPASLSNQNYLTRLLVKRKSSSTIVPQSASANKSRYNKIFFNFLKKSSSSSSSVPAPSSSSLISPQLQQPQDLNIEPAYPLAYHSSSSSSANHHIYNEPTLDDPSAYLDPTQIRIDPDEEMSWSQGGYSHVEGSVADTDYLDECRRQKRVVRISNGSNNNNNNHADDSVFDSAVVRQSLPLVKLKLDVKKYQLRRPDNFTDVTDDARARHVTVEDGSIYEEIQQSGETVDRKSVGKAKEKNSDSSVTDSTCSSCGSGGSLVRKQNKY